jgi:hypothetical protein
MSPTKSDVKPSTMSKTLGGVTRASAGRERQRGKQERRFGRTRHWQLCRACKDSAPGLHLS